MSIKNGRDYIYLIWKDIKTRRQYIVGELSKNGHFEFKYGFEVYDAIKQGFKLLISFEEIDKVYKNDILFPTFSSRLPDKKRTGIEKILSKYDLKEFDSYRLLKRSGAKLPIDNLEFIDPILDDNNVSRIFYLAGTRYYIGCNGIDCTESETLGNNEVLQLELEPENKYDNNAIKVLTKKGIHIGYIPRYYCESIINLINRGLKWNCNICEIKKDNHCNECIKVKFEMKQ